MTYHNRIFAIDLFAELNPVNKLQYDREQEPINKKNNIFSFSPTAQSH